MQVKPADISHESAGFGLHYVLYVAVDTSGAQACHVKFVCTCIRVYINVNVNVNAEARPGERNLAKPGRATLSARLNTLCENNDGLFRNASLSFSLDRPTDMQRMQIQMRARHTPRFSLLLPSHSSFSVLPLIREM